MHRNLITSKKGKEKYEQNGFIYVFDRPSSDGSRLFWRCDNRGGNEKIACKGRIWTDSSQARNFILIKTLHTCSGAGDVIRVEKQKINTEIKRRAETTMETPSQIRMEIIQKVNIAVLGQIPSANAMRTMVQRKRRNNQTLPNPHDIRDLIIPEIFSRYEISEGNFENFLLADSGDTERILIFGREIHRTWVTEMRQIFLDGTFLLTPPLFSQIFVLLARRGRYVFPILICLLPNKTGVTYQKLFNMIQTIWPQFNPESVSVDYELAIHNALRNTWPDACINGCFFHLVQNLRKHLSTTNLLTIYNTDSEFALWARMITSIAFLPEQDVEQALTELENNSPPQLEPIITWFTNTYVGRPRNNGTRAQPIFPHSVWSVRTRTLNGDDRTNNFAEAFHRKLQLGFGVAHPSFWKFLDGLKKMQKTFDADYERYLAGYDPPNKRTIYLEADERILTKVLNFDNNHILEYLRGLSHNYRME